MQEETGNLLPVKGLQQLWNQQLLNKKLMDRAEGDFYAAVLRLACFGAV